MKLSENFIYRRICGEALLMPVGEKTREYNGIFTLSETGAFLLDRITKGDDPHAACKALAEEFDISEETAAEDANEFFEQLTGIGILVD